MKIFLIMIICFYAGYRIAAFRTKRRMFNKLHSAQVDEKIGFEQWCELDSYLRNK